MGAPDLSRSHHASAQVRRAPKYGVFAALGAGLGLLATVLLLTLFDGSSEASPVTQVTYSPSQTFGFLALWCVPAGVVVGILVALILDRTIGTKTRNIRVARDQVDDA